LPDPPINIIHRGVLEELEARSELHISVEEWDRMPGTSDWITSDTLQLSKADVIAAFRAKTLISAVYAEASARKAQHAR